MPLIPVVKNANNKFTVLRVHYSSDPDKNTPEWKEIASRGMPPLGWLREYEIDYESYEGKVFFPEFNEYNIAKENVKYKDRETIYRGWDYGFHHPCCIITKLNEFDQWVWLKVILGEDEGIFDFGRRIRDYCFANYPGAGFIDADDIAGTQVSDKSEHTSREILESLGIYPTGQKQEIREGAEIIRQKLAIRVDGKPGLLVNPDQSQLIDGFKGGLHYHKPKEGAPFQEFYEKDGYYDHMFDAARYIAVRVFSVSGQKDLANEITGGRTTQEWLHRMGRVEGEPNEIGGDNDLKGFF